MNKKFKKIIRYLSITLLLTIVVQILLGAWVRLTGSGMSCPDWPLCYGLFFPTYSKINDLGITEYSYFQIFLEWIHRANAAFLIGPLTVVLFLFIFYNTKNSDKMRKFSYYLIVLLSIQGLLGGLTVFKSNIPWSVAIHLASAFLLLYLVLNILLLTLKNVDKIVLVDKPLQRLIYISFFLSLITACAGAFTSKYGASLSCSRWPLCNEALLPNFNDQFEIIHFLHRLLAISLVSFLFFSLYRLRTYYKDLSLSAKTVSFFIPLIIFIQILIGAFLIVFEVPTWMGIFHQFMGLLLFASISVLIFNIKSKNI